MTSWFSRRPLKECIRPLPSYERGHAREGIKTPPRYYLRVLKLLLLLSAYLVPIQAQQQPGSSITIGVHELRLGMPRDQVIAKLASSYDVSALPDRKAACKDSCFVWNKGSRLESPIGSVAFKSGRLSSVRVYWDPQDQQAAVPLARAIYGVLSRFVQDGATRCTVEVRQSNSPTSDERVAFIVCGERYISLTILRMDGSEETAILSEVLDR